MADDKNITNPEEGKPFPNEHACRLENPDKFTRFTRKNNAAKIDGKRVDHIFGFKAGGGSELQAIRFPKSIWTAAAARSACSTRGGSFEAASKEEDCSCEEKMESKDFSFEVRAEDVQETGRFVGYGSTFGGKPDSYGDVIAPGAFSKTLANGGRNGTGIAMLFQHNRSMIPGAWVDLREDKKGLRAEGQLALGIQLGAEIYELMKMEPAPAIRGLSIGFSTIDYEYNTEKKIRILKEVDLWEISLVTFPANKRAGVTGVKAAIEAATTERELEHALREACGLSKNAAMYLVSRCKSSLLTRDEPVRDESAIDGSMESIIASLRQNRLAMQVQRELAKFKN